MRHSLPVILILFFLGLGIAGFVGYTIAHTEAAKSNALAQQASSDRAKQLCVSLSGRMNAQGVFAAGVCVLMVPSKDTSPKQAL